MKLTAEEIQWVSDKLSGYDIKYQEVYDELKDHLLTAIENLRANGDKRDIETLFMEVVQAQFPGYWPFEEIVKQYLEAYGQKIRHAMWVNIKHYINWQTMLLTLLLVISGFYLPETKTITWVLIGVLLVTAIIPIVYIHLKAGKIKIEKGKRSLVKSYVVSRSYMLIWSFNVLFNLIAPLSRQWHLIGFLNPVNYPAVIFMLMFSCIIIYGLSCIRLCNQEFKVA